MKILHGLIALLLLTAQARAEDALPEKKVPLETFFNRSQGIVRRPSMFEWRQAAVILGLQLGQAVEFNNFASKQWGLDLRLPLSSMMYRTSLVQVKVQDTQATKDLERTPYLQAGRPSRLEWQNALEIPFMEGIASQLWAWIPASQFVLGGVVQLSSYLYGQQPLESLSKIYKTRLGSDERDELEASAPKSMRISQSRHDIGLGLQWDNYYALGLQWNFRALWHLSPTSTEKELSSWLSFGVGIGYAL